MEIDAQIRIEAIICSTPEQMERPFPFKSIAALLDWCFRISTKSDLHSPILTFEYSGSGGESIPDERLSSALVQAAIKRALGWDYLISCVEAIHGEDPASLCELVDQLSRSTGAPRGRVLREVEAFQLFRTIDSCRRPSHSEEKLKGWYVMAVDVLQIAFLERGWVEEAIDIRKNKI